MPAPELTVLYKIPSEKKTQEMQILDNHNIKTMVIPPVKNDWFIASTPHGCAFESKSDFNEGKNKATDIIGYGSTVESAVSNFAQSFMRVATENNVLIVYGEKRNGVIAAEIWKKNGEGLQIAGRAQYSGNKSNIISHTLIS